MSRKHKASMSFLHKKREKARLKKVRKMREAKVNKFVSTGDLLKDIKVEKSNEDIG
tara:strand:- start:346 stop:513 length:168 start_codon:yes stop_codon:yes gene_type:complete